MNTQKVTKIVKAHYVDGVSLDDTLASLMMEGNVPFSELQTVLKTKAHELGLILTPEELKTKVHEGVQGKAKPIDFSEVVAIAESLKIPQVAFDELLAVVQEEMGTNLREHAKFKELRKQNTKKGAIANWILSNPDFTAKELLESGVCDSDNAEAYYQEFLAYKAFFDKVHSLKSA